jgi:hypothetical protein
MERYRSERVTLRRKRMLEDLRKATTDEDRQRILRRIQDLDRAPAAEAGSPSP